MFSGVVPDMPAIFLPISGRSPCSVLWSDPSDLTPRYGQVRTLVWSALSLMHRNRRSHVLQRPPCHQDR